MAKRRRGKTIAENVLRLNERPAPRFESEVPGSGIVASVPSEEIGADGRDVEPSRLLLAPVVQHGKRPDLPGLKPHDKDRVTPV